jgi:hypothetical protein
MVFFDGLKDMDNPGVGATSDHNHSPVGGNDQGLFFHPAPQNSG